MEMKNSKWRRFSPTVPTTSEQSTWFVSSGMDLKMIFGFQKKISRMHKPSSKIIMTDKTTVAPTADQYLDSRLHAG
jgi:hypothetical protein